MGPPSNSKLPSSQAVMSDGNNLRSTVWLRPAVGINSHFSVLKWRPISLAAWRSVSNAVATA
eukprot:5087229-Karenia_brevis.AAC.1